MFSPSFDEFPGVKHSNTRIFFSRVSNSFGANVYFFCLDFVNSTEFYLKEQTVTRAVENSILSPRVEIEK